MTPLVLQLVEDVLAGGAVAVELGDREHLGIERSNEDGVFVATVPALPGCVSQGGTREGALRDVREAIEGYVDSLRERNEPIPPSIHEEVIDVAV